MANTNKAKVIFYAFFGVVLGIAIMVYANFQVAQLTSPSGQGENLIAPLVLIGIIPIFCIGFIFLVASVVSLAFRFLGERVNKILILGLIYIAGLATYLFLKSNDYSVYQATCNQFLGITNHLATGLTITPLQAGQVPLQCWEPYHTTFFLWIYGYLFNLGYPVVVLIAYMISKSKQAKVANRPLTGT